MQHEHNQILDTMDYDRVKMLVSEKTRQQFEEIEAGRRLPELYYDRTFKRIFDADMHPDRVEILFRLIFGTEEMVEGSLKNEMTHASIYSKQTILDVLSRLRSGGIFDLELQAEAQTFLLPRIQIYASDMILLQYSINRGEEKARRNFGNVEKSYLAVLMKKSQEPFRSSSHFLHRESRVTDTGIHLPSLVDIVYIELDKCLAVWEVGECPKEYEELAVWLCMIADVNRPSVKTVMEQNSAMESIQKELAVMAKDRKELARIMFEKYEKDVRYSEIESAKEEGRKEGRLEGHQEGRLEGHQEGRQEGLEQGRNEEKLRFQRLIAKMAEDNGGEQLAKLSEPGFLEEMYRKYQI